MNNLKLFQREVGNKAYWDNRDWIKLLDSIYIDIVQNSELTNIKNSLIRRISGRPNTREITTILNILRAKYIESGIDSTQIDKFLKTIIISELTNLNVIVYDAVTRTFEDGESPITDFSPSFNMSEDSYATRFLANTLHSWVNTDLLWSPAAIYSSTTDKSYFLISRDPQSAPFGQIIVIAYDALKGVDEHYIVGQPLEDVDTHQYPSVIITDSGVIKVTQEHEHTTPIDVYSSDANEDHTKWSKQAALYGTALAYNNLFRNANGTWTALCRGTGTRIYCAHIIHGDANFNNWGSQIQLSETAIAGTFRHYVQQPKNPTVGGWHYMHIMLRKDSAGEGIYSKICTIKTPTSGTDSWTKFYNVFENQVFDIVAAGRYFTEAEMLARFLMFSSNDEESQAYVSISCVDTNNRFYAINSKGDPTQYYFIYEDGSQWVEKAISGIANITNRGLIQAGAFQHLFAFSRNDIRAWVMIDTGVLNVFHTWEIKTTNLGDTWSLVRDMTPDFTISQYAILHLPKNFHQIGLNKNFPLLIQTNNGDLKFKKCAFGTPQAYNPPVVSPAADMAHASGLADWAIENRQVTGSVINSINDAFGLRNLTGISSPTYDSVEDCAVTNGTSSYFSTATTGLTTHEAMTFICVAKISTSAIILSISNNTVASRFLEFIVTGGSIQYQISNSSSPPLSTCTGNKRLVNDGQYHILAFVTKGVGFGVDLYVDGMKQPEINNAGSNIAIFNALGRGSNAVTSINAVRIASRDQSGTDLFYAMRFRRLSLYSSALNYSTLMSKLKFLSNTYSIPLVSQFE